MWAEYGIADFERAGTPMYELPDGGYMIVLWSGISLGIIATFLLVLFMIWKMDLFQEYKRMTNGIDDRQNILKNQSEIDISMFPSPHQIVPTLFPTNDTYIAGSTTINQSFNGKGNDEILFVLIAQNNNFLQIQIVVQIQEKLVLVHINWLIFR